jgi:hypothetical protein
MREVVVSAVSKQLGKVSADPLYMSEVTVKGRSGVTQNTKAATLESLAA